MGDIYAKENMIFTDGKIYGKILILGDDRQASEFREITIAEYEEIKAKELEDVEE